ncbi:MAG: hypothetical protein ABI972_28595 [Acidobacteriota bacterium]
MMTRTLLIATAAATLLSAQRTTQFEDHDALVLDNDKVELLVFTKGGAFASLTLKDDPAKLSALWNPFAGARAAGQQQRFGDSTGHFLCVDGFGGTSKEEAAAGFQGHGEAHRLPWEKISGGRADNGIQATFRVTLPLVQEVLTRKVSLFDGESVIAVDSELESLLSFDRPVNWAEHATIGSPFLSPEVTVVDASVGRCQTRPREGDTKRPDGNRLIGAQEFTYPNAPIKAGGTANLRAVPTNPNSMDHTGCAFDPSRKNVFVTAIRKDKGLVFGYLLRREEYPWLQEWMNYTNEKNLARGLEFGTQPYDLPRRVIVDMNNLFGVPTYRWLPAKSKISTRFLMFYAHAPAGFEQVDDVRLEGGKLILVDRKSGKKVELKTNQTL